MDQPEDRATRAAEVRDKARRARRWAASLSNVADSSRLIRYAEELEREADELEAAPPERPGPEQQQQAQQQQQQQPQAKDEPDGQCG